MNPTGANSTPVHQAGFWLPHQLRSAILEGADFETFYLRRGEFLESGQSGSVAVGWPRLDNQRWQVLLEGLQKSRSCDTTRFLQRWQAALVGCQAQMSEKLVEFLPVLSAATGYAPEMILRGFLSGNLSQVSSLASALDFRPTRAAAESWQKLPGLPGRTRFFPASGLGKLSGRLRPRVPLYRPAQPVELALGFAAGNVPGTGFLIALLGGLANAAHPGLPAPALIVRNSRHEPLFFPWLLDLIEAFDPELVAATAVLAWDYDDLALQRRLIGRAGLMVAAAGDDTIQALEDIRRVSAPTLRFHQHGHKVSFSAIGAETASDMEVARLGALDSSIWDQNGCLSARLHFVEGDALAYASHLVEAMQEATTELPRGSLPRRFTHRAFDTFKNLENTGKVKVFSRYGDDFAVILDERPWEAITIRRAINACQGRTAVVRPVRSLNEVPDLLRLLPPDNLQTLGLSCAQERILPLATSAGAAGITAVRSLGRAAFPQLAYSWDGYLPLDAACLRPAGHWTGIEME